MNHGTTKEEKDECILKRMYDMAYLYLAMMTLDVESRYLLRYPLIRGMRKIKTAGCRASSYDEAQYDCFDYQPSPTTAELMLESCNNPPIHVIFSV